MARIQTLCEFLADNGGLRAFRNQRDTVGASDLRAIGAAEWHKAKPFRRKLVHIDSGMCPDDAALAAFEAGYFPGLTCRPEIQDLIDAIDAELAGKPVYTAPDSRMLYEQEMAAYDREETMDALYDLTAVPVAQDVPGRVIPPYSEIVTGACGEVVYLYEAMFITKKGREGKSFYAKAFRAGEKRHAWHHVYPTHEARMDAVNEFLAENMEMA